MANRGRTITIEQNASYDSFLLKHGERLMSRGFSKLLIRRKALE